MIAVPDLTSAPKPTIRVPVEPAGLGTIPAAGDRIMLRAGDRFAATWAGEDEIGLCCRVIRKRGRKYQCMILNGAWGLTFDEDGQAKHRERTAKIVMLLPRKLANVADMDDWDRVLQVVDQQLRKAKKKPARAQST